jgi:aryl-alcohol dehydrogenase-like predicted oxidoreductase
VRERRKNVLIASKYGITRDAQGALKIDNRPQSIRASVDSSLQRLGFDCIDLFYLHRIDPAVAIEESVGALAGLVREGKIRFIGLSECSVQTLRRAYAVHPVSAVQTEYSLWAREPEAAMLAACRELGVTFVAYSPLGRGFLAGNFRTLAELPEKDHRRPLPRYQDANIAHNARIVDLVREFAQRKGCTAAQIALAWVLAQGEGVTAIPGMKTRAHLRDNVGALEVQLTAAEQQELRTKVAAIPVQGDRHNAAMMKALDG